MDPISSSFLGYVSQRLLDAAQQEYRLVKGVKEEIRKFAFMVRAVRGVLQDAERKQLQDDAVRVWLEDLKQLLLDAEDVLDEIAIAEEGSTRSVTRRAVNKLLGSVNRMSTRRAIAHQIADINKRFDAITRVKDGLGLHHHVLGENGSTVIPFHRETSSALSSGDRIVAREDEMKKMMRLLLDVTEWTQATSSVQNVQVISVVGMGGIGKTTLVQHVYNDPVVAEYFQLRMWVCVSNNFDVKRITKEIADAASKSEKGKEAHESSSNWDATLTSLREKLQGKRFLLVLDDVWEEDASKWEALCVPLSHGAQESRIVVSTRSKKVSGITKGTPISLNDLSNQDLWLIFQKYAFDGSHDPEKNKQLEYVGRQIVDKLKGSPLVAKTVGRLLNSKMDMKHWMNILKSEALEVLSQDHEVGIIPTLKLSYDHLSGNLKECFKYCSLFPQDHRFCKDELIRLWMAQQFIQVKEGSHPESVGSDCFDSLMHMSLFEKCSDGDEYVMHDLIHDLACSVAKDDCLRLLIDDQHKAASSETIRHISMINKSSDLDELVGNQIKNYKNSRTFLFLGGREINKDLQEHHLDELFRRLQRLRVLGLSDCGIRELPKSFGTLKHLRYLDLSENYRIWELPKSIGNLKQLRYLNLHRSYNIEELPESLCDLQNLQVLNLQDCRWMKTLPSNMSALINLRHLLLTDGDESTLASSIRGLGKLTALHELRFDCGTSWQRLKDLANMSMLRQLIIESLEEVKSKEEAMESRLHDKEHLDDLELVWGWEKRYNPGLEEEVVDCLRPTNSIRRLSITNYGGIRSPCWMENPSWVCPASIETLKISNCEDWEEWVVRPEVAQRINGNKDNLVEDYQVGGEGGEETTCLSLFLPRLRKLTVKACLKLRQLPPLPPSLRKLKIIGVGLTELPEWLPSTSSMPSLSSLEVSNCPKLTSLAVGLLRYPLLNLMKLKIRRCEELLSLPKTAFGNFTSLERLKFKDCPKLSRRILIPEQNIVPPSPAVDVRIEEDTGSETTNALLGGTRDCHFDIPSSIQKLTIGGNDSLNNESLLSLLQGLASLKSLKISRCPAIASLPMVEELPQLTTLQVLSIKELKGLKSLGGLLQSGVSLDTLVIDDCPELLDFTPSNSSPSSSTTSSRPASREVSTRVKRLTISKSSPMQIKACLLQCNGLQHLYIDDCPLLTGFGGEDYGHVGGELEAALINLSTTLRNLNFFGCKNLRSLPPKLRSLSTLETLTILFSPEIQRLPESGLPESLRSLITSESHDSLKERCEKGRGSDWHLISHIPDLRIR